MLKSKSFKIIISLLIGLFTFSTMEAAAVSSNSEDKGLLNQVLQKLETRYKPMGFTALFTQESTVKALEITDIAVGRITVKRPDKMRWTYEKPEKQIIITDGRTLWVYRPEENQVMVGASPALLGDGQGASFLTDIEQIKRKFDITLAEKSADHYHLKLIPLKKTPDLAVIHILIDIQTSDITEIITYNVYGDETRIRFTNIQFKQHLDDALFTFDIPEGADVIQMNEE